MKKSNFMAMVLGSVSGTLFALGMCMALLTEWNAFRPGIIMGIAGLVLGLITVFVWRRMEHKPRIRLSGKVILRALIAVLGSIILGVGMCFAMVWSNLVLGVVIGLAGIIILMCQIPMYKGLK